nr:MAG TPA: LPS-assembly protein [Caudoviricetes sp.]
MALPGCGFSPQCTISRYTFRHRRLGTVFS